LTLLTLFHAFDRSVYTPPVHPSCTPLLVHLLTSPLMVTTATFDKRKCTFGPRAVGLGGPEDDLFQPRHQ